MVSDFFIKAHSHARKLSLKIIFDCFTPHVCVQILLIFHTKILKVFMLTCSIHFYGPYFRTSIFYIKKNLCDHLLLNQQCQTRDGFLDFFFIVSIYKTVNFAELWFCHLLEGLNMGSRRLAGRKEIGLFSLKYLAMVCFWKLFYM